jgi:hypothetical protein
MTVPIWMLMVAPVAVGFLVALCAYLMLKRLNYYTSVLLKNAIDATIERKTSALHAAASLASERETTALVLSKKVEDTADVLSKKVEDTAASLAVRVEESAIQILDNIQEDLKAVHKRLHNLEGSVFHKEAEINEMLDTHEAGLMKEKKRNG